jgi:UrcA family protein
MKKICLAALGALIAASPAVAADNPFARDSVVLSLRDLDLSTVDGQQRLAIRMDQAANAVCGQGLDKVHLALAAKAQTCRDEVVADIRTRIAAATAAKAPARAVLLASR